MTYVYDPTLLKQMIKKLSVIRNAINLRNYRSKLYKQIIELAKKTKDKPIRITFAEVEGHDEMEVQYLRYLGNGNYISTNVDNYDTDMMNENDIIDQLVWMESDHYTIVDVCTTSTFDPWVNHGWELDDTYDEYTKYGRDRLVPFLADPDICKRMYKLTKKYVLIMPNSFVKIDNKLFYNQCYPK